MHTRFFYYISFFAILATFSCTRGYAQLNDSTAADDTLQLESITTATIASDSIENCRSNDSADAKLNKGNKPSKITIYDLPYSRTTRMEDWKRLSYNTATFVGAGIVTLLVLECLPEGATAWDKTEIKNTPFWKRYGNNVAAGPVWDKDNFVFNYILHPYGGAVYYMGARSNGFNMLGSCLYATFVSAVLWEYGIEAFMEIPSIQDLFVTPIAGTIVGEGFYQLKRKIVHDDYRLFGSKAAGVVVAWFIDPLNEFVSLFAGNPCKRVKPGHISSISCTPNINFMGKHPRLSLSAVVTF